MYKEHLCVFLKVYTVCQKIRMGGLLHGSMGGCSCPYSELYLNIDMSADILSEADETILVFQFHTEKVLLDKSQPNFE